MSGFWARFRGRFGSDTPGTAQMAKERLQFVLVHDRINLPPEKMAEMKEEILAVISKYIAVAGSKIDIALRQQDRHSGMLVAEIPFLKNIVPETDLPLLEDDDDEDTLLPGDNLPESSSDEEEDDLLLD